MFSSLLFLIPLLFCTFCTFTTKAISTINKLEKPSSYFLQIQRADPEINNLCANSSSGSSEIFQNASQTIFNNKPSDKI